MQVAHDEPAAAVRARVGLLRLGDRGCLLLLLLLSGRLRLLLLLLRLRLRRGGRGLLLAVVVIVAAADQHNAGRADAGPRGCAQHRAPTHPSPADLVPVVSLAHDALLHAPRCFCGLFAEG